MPASVPQQHDTRPDAAPARPALGQVKVRSDKLSTHYANVVTTNANRDEVAVCFGVKAPGSEDPVEVRMHTRISMNPHAAKRLLLRLAQLPALQALDAASAGPTSAQPAEGEPPLPSA